MFKIEIEKRHLVYHQNDSPYFIRYELIPDISKGVYNRIIHEANYTNLQLALKDASKLSEYITEISVVLDLIYTKIKQIEISINQSAKYLKIDFNRVEQARITLLITSSVTLPAHIHISNIMSFINSLKYWCFAICKNYQTIANQLFKMLLELEQSFINTYRSAQMLNESNQLKLFL